MEKSIFLSLILFLIITSISALPRGVELLGVKIVNFKAEKDEIIVTRAEGVFKKIAFKINNNAIEIFRLVVVYGNGERDTIPVNWIFKKGDRSRVIDLKGNKRVIKKIVFFYRTVGRIGKGRAEVKVYGVR